MIRRILDTLLGKPKHKFMEGTYECTSEDPSTHAPITRTITLANGKFTSNAFLGFPKYGNGDLKGWDVLTNLRMSGYGEIAECGKKTTMTGTFSKGNAMVSLNILTCSFEGSPIKSHVMEKIQKKYRLEYGVNAEGRCYICFDQSKPEETVFLQLKD